MSAKISEISMGSGDTLVIKCQGIVENSIAIRVEGGAISVSGPQNDKNKTVIFDIHGVIVIEERR